MVRCGVLDERCRDGLETSRKDPVDRLTGRAVCQRIVQRTLNVAIVEQAELKAAEQEAAEDDRKEKERLNKERKATEDLDRKEGKVTPPPVSPGVIADSSESSDATSDMELGAEEAVPPASETGSADGKVEAPDPSLPPEVDETGGNA